MKNAASNKNIDTEQNIFIVGPRRFQNELLHYYLDQTVQIPCTFCHDDALPKEIEGANRMGRQLFLWDGHGSDYTELLDSYQKCTRNCDGRKSFIAFIGLPSENRLHEQEIASLGIHGAFYENDSLATILKGVKFILKGELWFSRETLSRSLSTMLNSNDPAPAEPSPAANLTRREKEILQLLISGKTNNQIARQLCISPLTVKTHVHNLFSKIDVPNRMQALLWATKNHHLIQWE